MKKKSALILAPALLLASCNIKTPENPVSSSSPSEPAKTGQKEENQ